MKGLTKGQIRKIALKMLTMRGCHVWIQNNLHVPGRKFIGEPGIADISGYVEATGLRVECEVKTKTDRLSDDQRNFLTRFAISGGLALIAKEDKGGNVVLETWLKSQEEAIK